VTRSRQILIGSLSTAAFVAAVLVFVAAPPRPLSTASAGDAAAPTLRGALHIHTIQSDGALDRQQIALAASRAGLHFAIFTDHGDGTRAPQPPQYLHGVLCIDGVEVSTNQGHYLALGAAPSPYPLGGDAEAVAEDVTRLGGFGIVAHPFSPRAELAWTDWSVPLAGLEWLNADSEWRDEGRPALARALVGYLSRPEEALASLFDRPVAALAKLDSLATSRHVVAVAGHDAHGGFGEEDESRGRRLHLPSYEAAFRAFSINVQTGRPLERDAAADASAVLEAIRLGRVFTAIDAIAGPAALDFTARDGATIALPGDVLPADGREVRFTARAAIPAGSTIALLRNGEVARESASNTVDYASREPGGYRVEVRVPGAPGTPPIPWIVSSPIFRFATVSGTPAAEAPAMVVRTIATGEWRIEKGGGSTATFTRAESGATLAYRIGTNPSPYTALAADLQSPQEPFSAVSFRARASRPMRLSAQLRFGGDGAIRWRRSVYVDAGGGSFVLPTSAFRAADRPGNMPPPERATAILFVVDTINAAPGDEGSFTIQNVELRR
jgi:hypothetical protein